MIWSAYPRLAPFVDGRQLSQKRFFDFLNAVKRPTEFFEILIANHGISLVVLETTTSFYDNLIRYLQGSADWQLIYLKGKIMVYVQPEKYSLSQKLLDFDKNHREIKIEPEGLKKIGKIAASYQEDMIKDMYFPLPAYIDFIEESNLFYSIGYIGASQDRLIKMIKKNDQKINQLIARYINTYKDSPTF